MSEKSTKTETAFTLDPIQNKCIYGYVLPDRCRFMRHKGCECGAYAPQYWDGERWHSGTE